VRRYAVDLQNLFAQESMQDSYTQKVVSAIDDAWLCGHVHQEDHLSTLYDYWVRSGQREQRDAFSGDLLCAISQKFDLELRRYADIIHNDDRIRNVCVIAGAYHVQFLEHYLNKLGYHVVQKEGVDISEIKHEKDMKNLTKLLLNNLEIFNTVLDNI